LESPSRNFAQRGWDDVDVHRVEDAEREKNAAAGDA
jgi:hypothetical protein